MSFLKDSWNYLSAEIATKGLAFISIPVFTRLLSPDEYGYLNVITAIAGIVFPLFSLNLTVGIGRYYFEKNKNDFNAYFSLAIGLGSILLITGMLISLFFQAELAELLSIPESTIPYIGITALMLYVSNLILVLHRAQKNTKELRTITILRGYGGFGIAVGIMFLLNSEIYFGRLYTNAAVLAASTAYFFWRFKDRFKFAYKKKHLAYMINYGLPLIPANLSAVLLMEFDRIMINSYQGPSQSGIYSFAYNISMLLLVLSNALQYAFMPEFFKLMNEGKIDRVKESYRFITSLVSCGAIGLILFGTTIGALLGTESYHGSLVMIPIIVLGQYFLSFVPLYKQGISLRKKTIYSSITILSAGALNVVLNAIYIPQYGATAGAITTVVSYIFQFLLVYIIVKFILKVDLLELYKLLPGMFAVIAAIVFYFLLSTYDLSRSIDLVIRSLVVLVLTAILILPHRRQILNYL